MKKWVLLYCGFIGFLWSSDFDPVELETLELPRLRPEFFIPYPSALDKKKPEAPSLRVLSWNVGQTKNTKELQVDFESNIVGVVESPGAPDLLLLIEAGQDTFKSLDKIPLKEYGYDQTLIVPYSTTNPWAYFVLIWKSEFLKLKNHSIKSLNFELKTDDVNELSYYNKLRRHIGSEVSNLEDVSLQRFDFEIQGEVFSLYPVHLSNVWPSMETYMYPMAREGARHWLWPKWAEEKNARFSTKAVVLKNLLQENNNPHSISLKSLIEQVNQEHPINFSPQDSSVLVMGDFNAFPRIDTFHGIVANKVFGTEKSHACAEMEKHFSPIYLPEPDYSFPSNSFKNLNPDASFKLLIDLAYMRGPLFRLAKADLLPLAGSDHYPVYYTILLKP